MSSLRERIARVIYSSSDAPDFTNWGDLSERAKTYWLYNADAVLAELGPELGRKPVEMEWCWVDHAGRQMTNWNRDTPPPMHLRKASDEKGTMWVEMRVVTAPQPQPQYSDIVSDGGLDPRNKYDTPQPQASAEDVALVDQCVLAGEHYDGNLHEAWQRIRASLGVSNG